MKTAQFFDVRMVWEALIRRRQVAATMHRRGATGETGPAEVEDHGMERHHEAVVRWTARQVLATGVEVAKPGATVFEVRDGRVERMTLYYDSEGMALQE